MEREGEKLRALEKKCRETDVKADITSVLRDCLKGEGRCLIGALTIWPEYRVDIELNCRDPFADTVGQL